MVFSIKAKTNQNTTAGLILTSKGIALAIINHELETARLTHAKLYPCNESEQVSQLAQLVKQHHLDTIPCNFVLNPDEYQFLQVEAPKVSKQELPAALRWHIKDLIDFHIDDVVVDHITLPIDSMPLQVVVTRKSLIQSRVDLLLTANCQLDTIDIAVQAARNLISTIKPIPSGMSIGLLNLWDNSAKISVFKDHDLYINRLTEIGMESLEASAENQSEIETLADTLAVELQRTFDYYESYSRHPAVEQLLIMSNSTPIANLDAMIQQRLGVECRIVTTADFSEMDIDLGTQNTELSDACLMAIGGALRVEQ